MSIKQVTGFIVVVAMAAAGCRVRATGYVEPPPPVEVRATVATPPPPSASVTVTAGQPQVYSGVQVVQATCTQGGAEQCNGLDDNCNGQIDEGCGYASGAIQITLAWGSGADLDLYVTDPNGETLSYMNRQVSSGGYLDHDARGNCNPSQANNRIENVYWNSPQPPRGTYRVEVHYWGECNSGAGVTPLTLSVAVGGRVIGAYTFGIAPQQRIPVVTFSI
ncbi:MAG: hypothetical protein NZ898_07335 [Myxococcota bacterium]|nr:hypothetical protein [Myxococcota bacterium]MDW8362139.1 hypothetical protein [Myxococcales bacterium]